MGGNHLQSPYFLKKSSNFEHFMAKKTKPGVAEAGVTGVARNTQYLAAFFHKLSGKKKFFKSDKI